jgi:Probable Zinc-ribbon domain
VKDLGDQSIALTLPNASLEWNSEKNGTQKPSNTLARSHRKIWWVCSKGHEWQTSPAKRMRGDGCPYCSGHRVSVENNLSSNVPRLLKEWHRSRNGGLLPSQVTSKSAKKVWWVCSKGHEWYAAIYTRSKGHGCPFCSGRRISPENSLSAKAPELVREWHPTRNGSILPSEVACGSQKRYWWVCSKGHEWETAAMNRTRGHGCPYCSKRYTLLETSIEKIYPSLASEWNLEKNGNLKPSSVSVSSGKKVWWKCKRGHEWQAVVAKRSAGGGCPYCTSASSVLELRVLAELRWILGEAIHRHKVSRHECDIYLPGLQLGIEVDSLYWHNGRIQQELAKNAFFQSARIRLLRVREVGLPAISKDDIWYTRNTSALTIVGNLLERLARMVPLPNETNARILEYSKMARLMNDSEFTRLCDCLPGPTESKSLAILSPEIAAEWNHEKNGQITPLDVFNSSNKLFWWKCKRGHEWRCAPSKRTSAGQKCPYCSGKRVNIENCLQTRAPELSLQWNHNKNGNLTPRDVTTGSNKVVWWKCERGHESRRNVSSRYRGAGCPYCAGQRPCSDNSLAAIHPAIAAQWHPTKNGVLSPHSTMPGSAKKAWWRCDSGHEWLARIASRTHGNGCPFCSNRAKLYQKHLSE